MDKVYQSADELRSLLQRRADPYVMASTLRDLFPSCRAFLMSCNFKDSLTFVANFSPDSVRPDMMWNPFSSVNPFENVEEVYETMSRS